MVYIIIENVTVRFGKFVAVDDFCLEIERGEFISLLGPSGCGKTTLLRVIAGFIKPDEGSVYVDNKLMNKIPPYGRHTGFVFQNYALFPHKTIKENIGFGLKMRALPKSQIDRRVLDALKLLKLESYEDRFPVQLSGGQQQRVALARAIVINPSVLLLDEPLGALDKRLREEMQVELKNLQRKLGVTTIFVTHDQEEALTMSDRIAVINEGRIEQVGSPEAIYERPEKRFVSSFIGTSNFIPARFLESNHVCSLFEIENSGGARIISGPTLLQKGKAYEYSIRPEKISILRYKEGEKLVEKNENLISGHISNLIYIGTVTHVYVETDIGIPIVVYQQNMETRSAKFSVSDKILLTWKAENSVVLSE